MSEGQASLIPSVPVRFGVAGYGAIRRSYGAALRVLPDGQIATLYDPEAEAPRASASREMLREWVRELHQPPVFADYARFLAEGEGDALLIAAPLNTLGENPLARPLHAATPIFIAETAEPTLAQVTEIARAANIVSGIVACAFPRRHEETFALVQQRVQEGSIGRLTQVRCDLILTADTLLHGRDVPLTLDLDPYSATGIPLVPWRTIFRHYALQSLDLCCQWLGAIRTVSADIDIVVPGRSGEERAHLICNHTDGISIHHISRLPQRNGMEQYVLEGTKGAIEISTGRVPTLQPMDVFRAVQYRSGLPPEEIVLPAAPVTLGALARRQREIPVPPYARTMMERFLAAVRARQTDLDTLDSLRHALEVVQAAYIATVERNRVTLPVPAVLDLDALLDQWTRHLNRPLGEEDVPD